MMFLIVTASLAEPFSKNRITSHIPPFPRHEEAFVSLAHFIYFCLLYVSQTNHCRIQTGHLTPGYSIRYGSPRCCPFLMSLQKDEETETCTVNMNITKSPQANRESSLEKGRGVLSIVYHYLVLLPPLFTALVWRQESSSLL